MLILYFFAKIPKIFDLDKLLILYLYLKILKLLFIHKPEETIRCICST